VELPSRVPLGERLRRIQSAVGELLREHAPAALALEKAFVASNVQSAFRLGEARGAVLIAAAAAGVPVFEYAPAQVKLTVVGYGRADKKQMVRGVALRLGTPSCAREDEADALALALWRSSRRRRWPRCRRRARRSSSSP
jgi:crossover junction endodeoxyribonuclease RuvC